MPKFQLTPLDDETASRIAAKAQGKTVRFVVPLRPDMQIDVMARAFDGASFDRHFDDTFESPDDAVTNTLIRHILWPYGAELDALVNAFGFLPGQIIGAIVKAAGGGSGARIDTLNEGTPDGVLAAAALAPEKAAELVDAAGGLVALSLVTLPRGGGALVVRAPSYASLQRLERAYRKKTNCAQACRQAVLDGTAWSTEKIDTMLQRLPALAANVVAPEILRLGGAGADEAQFRGVGPDQGAPL